MMRERGEREKETTVCAGAAIEECSQLMDGTIALCTVGGARPRKQLNEVHEPAVELF